MRLFASIILLLPFFATAQTIEKTKELPKSVKWYESISIRGYSQIRYNRLLETNGGFFMRRMRVIFFGQIGPKVYFYVQPDFASSPSSDRLHFGQIRDAYFDIGLDDDNEFRLRIGQSKVPYGFENMQSSQNRIPLDRNVMML